MSDIEQVFAGAGAADVVNANFRAVSPSALYGRRSSGSGGLSFSYYGGVFNGNDVADGAITLTASQAAVYVVAALADGTVSQSTGTTNWNDTTNYFRIAQCVTGASTITTVADKRQAYTPGGGGGGGDVVGPASAVNNRVAFFDGTTGKLIKDSGLSLSGSNTGDQTSVTGNAGTATALATSRNIDGQAFDGTADITIVAPGTHAATGKTTPVDADEIPLVDSAASNVLKKVTWLNVKATLKAYFDTIYGTFVNPMTTAGDVITGGSAGAAQRLAVGSNGNILTVVAGAPAWAAPVSGGDVVGPSSAVSGRVATFNGTTGKLIQDGGTLLAALAPLASPAFTGTATPVNMTFSGLLTTTAAATGGAGLNLPHGAAPTSPVNGDVWTTTGGIYARINGATVGPLAAGGGGGTPAGSTTEIQYNNAGAFGSEAAFTYDASTNTLTVDKINTAKGTDITRAGTSDIGAATGNYVHLTGTTTVTALGTVAAGATRIVKFTGAGTLTHNATSLILPGAANITTAANDCAIFASLGSGNWQCIAYSKASGLAVVVASPTITGFTSSLNTASPNGTVNAARLLTATASTDGDMVLQPKGVGALMLSVPDNTATGGNKRGASAVDLQLLRTAAANVASGGQSFIGAGQFNTASGTSAGVVAGDTNTVSSNNGFCGGGNANAVTTGNNAANLGGANNTASGTGAITLGGSTNIADSAGSVAMGIHTQTNGMLGVVVRASGSSIGFAQGGRQARDATLQADTTNTTATALTTDGAAAGAANQFVILSDSALKIKGQVIVRNPSTKTVGWWDISGACKNSAGTTSLVGTPVVSAFAGDAALNTCTVSIVADATNNCLQVRGTGVAATALNWSCEATSVEMVA